MNRYYLAMLLIFFVQASYANDLELHTKAWFGWTQTGKLACNSNFLYYLDAELEFIDDRYKFEEAYGSFGFGYKTLPNLNLFLGNTYLVSKKTSGIVEQQYRLWQQADWAIVKSISYSLSSRTRLEERKNFTYSAISVRLREKATMTIPLANYRNLSVIISDEVFFNLNRPVWVPQRFFEQNRAFIGFGKNISKYGVLVIGYMNQYQLTQPNQMSNILYVSVNYKCY